MPKAVEENNSKILYFNFEKNLFDSSSSYPCLFYAVEFQQFERF